MFTPFEALREPDVAVFGAVIPPALRERDTFEWLDPDEAAAAAGMRSPRRRTQFVAGRWLLRYAARHVFGDAGYILRTIDGRPRILASGPAAVTISHCADVVLCAAGDVPALGVDVELLRPRRDWSALAAFVLHPQERSALETAPDAYRWEGFYRAWTRKEAIAKALGVGVFGLSLDRILLSGDRVRDAPASELPDCARWTLRELSVGERMAAAVAWRT